MKALILRAILFVFLTDRSFKKILRSRRNLEEVINNLGTLKFPVVFRYYVRITQDLLFYFLILVN